MMVLDVLKLISNEEKRNIYSYLKHTIENDSIGKAYRELIKIRAIADKLAGLIIRDIGLMNLGIISEDYEMAFPIDTWVAKMAQRLGCNDEDYDVIKEFLLGKCSQYNVNPLKFAVGLWMWGFNDLDIEG